MIRRPAPRLGRVLLAVLALSLLALVFPGQVFPQVSAEERDFTGQASPATPPENTPGFVPGRAIVKVGSEAASRALESTNERLRTRTRGSFPELDVKVVEFSPNRPVGEVLAAYRREPGVEYAESDFLRHPAAVPNDPLFGRLWGLHNTGQEADRAAGTVDADIDAPEAWDTTRGERSSVVALVDTGVNTEHPDLKESIWTNPGEVPGDEEDNDGNGKVDDVNGWDFYNGDGSVYDEGDGEEHGTHTAGTLVAAADNGIGVSGVAPGASLMPLKACGPLGCPSSAIIAAFDYAVDKDVKVVNGSFGGGAFSQAEHDAIERGREKGVLFVFPAGNGAGNNDAVPFYPASYENENVISVAASDNRDGLAGFSNSGAASVDLAAPGAGILSTGVPSLPAPVAVRVAGSYDSIYAGFGLEQIASPEARRDFLSKALSDLSAPSSAPVLLVDDDGGEAHEAPYREALETLGFSDVTVSTVSPGSDGPGGAEMEGQVVVWLTGDEYSETLRAADQERLSAHLDGGGKLLLMGQDIGFDIGGGRPGTSPTGFYTEYLKARLIVDDLDPESTSGVAGGPFDGGTYPLSGGDGADYDRYIDRLGSIPGGSTAAILSDASPATYRSMSGTSMAAPHVSGVAALLRSRDPSAGYAEVKAAILGSAEERPAFAGRTVTGGRLNADAALAVFSPTAPVAEPTKLTLRSSKTVVPYNGKTLLTGRLTDSSGKRLAGEPVTVWRSKDGGRTWAGNGKATYDPPSGSYRAVRSLTANAAFQLRFAGSQRYEPSISRAVLVRARAYLSRPDTPLVVKRGAYFTIQGYLKPRHSGYTRLYLQRYAAGEWRPYTSVNARNADLSGYTRYSLRYKPPSAGLWRVRAYHADPDHAPTWSPPKRFVVRP